MTAMAVRPRWISPAARPATGGTLLRLAAGIYIVRTRQWVSTTALDHNADLPSPEDPDLVRRRLPHRAWQLSAGCRTVDQAVFFGDEIEVEGPRRRPVLARALQWCRPCAVRVVCLAHALLKSEDYGIWGGHSARDRELLKADVTAGAELAVVIALAAGVPTREAAEAIAEAA